MEDQVFTERIKKGYLNEDFLFFNLKDQRENKFQPHYHDFNKIIIFISGQASYVIEGKSYKLKPWDILLVGSGDLHLPIISSSTPYHRIVLWLNPLFLEGHNKDNSDLLNCFTLASKRHLNLIRSKPGQITMLKQVLSALEEEMANKSFGNAILKNALFIQLIVIINRLFLGMDISQKIEDITYDGRIEAILDFVNENLDKDLSIDLISKTFYLSRYYLMHSFKKETGYTLYSYIQKKKLIKASNLIKSGIAAGEVCSLCGFGDYSSFVRAFKKEFKLSPRQYYDHHTTSFPAQ